MASCAADGVDNGNGVSTATCGFRWTTGTYDGLTGAGQQMNALGALISVLVAIDPDAGAGAPVTNSTGGTSAGNPNAGTDSSVHAETAIVQTKDRAGAGIITALLLLTFLPALAWAGSSWAEGRA